MFTGFLKLHFFFCIVLVTKLNVKTVFCNVDNNTNYRLPNNTKPLNYKIEIDTNMENDNFTFTGITKIKILVLNVTNEILLHTKYCKIKNINLQKNNGEQLIVKSDIYYLQQEILKIVMNDNLELNQIYELRIKYNGELRNDRLGFYKSSYINEIGDEIFLGLTHFFPAEARHAFPCYDEPKFKAVFQLSITHPRDRNAISNADISTKTYNSDGITATTQFKDTPLMSTYLVNFIISDFVNSTTVYDTFTFEFYSKKNLLKYTKLAEQFGIEIYGKFLTEFGKQPFRTMKQVAVPKLIFSAMENWGIIHYDEVKIIYNEHVNNQKQFLQIIDTVAHEISHQWFGNLVTMEWFTYMWLNEGFATLYSYYGIDMIYSKFQIMQYFQITIQQRALHIDSRPLMPAMSFYLEKPSDLFVKSNYIVYNKAACFLRMLENAIAKQTFKKAIHIYLNKRKFNTSTEHDLCLALEESIAENKNIKKQIEIRKIVHSWTSQPGFPLLTVTTRTSTVQLKQERFLENGTSTLSTWYIPISFETPNGHNFEDTTAKFWMHAHKQNYTVNCTEWAYETDWIIFNVQQTGFYRVNYDLKNWNLIINALMDNHTLIHPMNRAQLIDDAFALANINLIPYEILFRLLKYISYERQYAPWAAYNENMNSLKLKINVTSSFQKFFQILLHPAFIYFNSTIEDYDCPLETLTQNIVLNQYCSLNFEVCSNSSQIFNDPNMKYLYYCNRLRNNDSTAYDDLKVELKIIKNTSQKRDLINALGCYKNENAYDLLLLESTRSINDLKLNQEEKLALFKTIYQTTKVGYSRALKFLMNHLLEFTDYYGENSTTNMLIDMARCFSDPIDVNDFNKVLNKIKHSRALTVEVREHMIKNLGWNLKNQDDIYKFIINELKPIHTSNLKPKLGVSKHKGSKQNHILKGAASENIEKIDIQGTENSTNIQNTVALNITNIGQTIVQKTENLIKSKQKHFAPLKNNSVLKKRSSFLLIFFVIFCLIS